MKLVLAALMFAALAAVPAFADRPSDPAPVPPRPVPRARPDPAKTYAVAIDPLDVSDGPADARVTIIEAYDYACPYCERARSTMAKVKATYGKDVRIVYKQFVIHPTAMPSALAACAAARQHKFAELDALLWDAYKARSVDKDDTSDPTNPRRCWEAPGGCPIVTAAATTAQLDLGKFTRDLASCKPNVTRVTADMARFGVSGIPGFFINGRAISGAMPFESFQKVIDEELALANDRIKQGARPATYYQKWVLEKGLKALEPVAQIPTPERPDPSIIPPRQPPVIPARPPRPMPDPAKTYALAIDPADVTLGPANAKVTIVEATDYACPFCERVRETLTQLQARYGKDLRIVFKQLVVHPTTAMPSALAACAAAKQQKFAAMDALLWDNFKTRTFDTDGAADPDPNSRLRCWESPAGCPVVLAAAKAAKLDLARFKRDMVACKANVDRAAADFAKFGVSAIPTFFINGRHLQGAQPPASFERIIDEELALANARIKGGTKAARYYQQWVVDKGLEALEPVSP